MTVGIIYKAENLITSKVYIGQTTHTLEYRIKGHYSYCKNRNYKFANALRKYKKEDWNWEILEEVDKELLNEREIYYISKFNSYKKGYNSTLGGDNPPINHSKTIYELYHPNYGIIIGTKQDFKKIDASLGNSLHKLQNNKYLSFKGFVLAINKNNYNKILNIHSLYNPKYGVITATYNEFYHKYFNKDNGLSNLVSRKYNQYKGWVLAENKDNYDKLLNIVTLEHEEYGIYSMKAIEFIKKYNLNKSTLYKVIKGEYKQYKGWKLVTNP